LCARQSSFNDTRKDEEDPLFVTFYSSLLRGNESWHLLRGNLWDTRLRQVVDSLVCTSLLWIGMAIKMLLLQKKRPLPPYGVVKLVHRLPQPIARDP